MTGADIPEETRYAVLGTIVFKKMATVGAVASATGLDVDTVRAAFDELETSGAVFRAEEQALPTEVAAKQVREYADHRYGTVRSDPAVERWMARFETQNRHFLETVSAWQQIDVDGRKVANDHSDPEYDAQVLARIDATLARMAKLIGELSTKVPRVARYGERLQEAFDKVDAGDLRYLSDPMVDSVRNIWFELHEDILTILGKGRAE
jgi:predicted ArsR family transcriptional regulator